MAVIAGLVAGAGMAGAGMPGAVSGSPTPRAAFQQTFQQTAADQDTGATPETPDETEDETADVTADTDASIEIGNDAVAVRIVPEPRGVSIDKTAFHPFTWMGAAVKPLVRFATKFGTTEWDWWGLGSVLDIGVDGLGSGSGLGPRVDLIYAAPGDIELTVGSTFTYRRYESYRAGAAFPLFSWSDNSSVGFDLYGEYLSRASERFYGIGNGTEVDDLTRFRELNRRVGSALTVTLGPSLKGLLAVEQRDVDILEPLQGGVIDTRNLFTEDELPGLDTGARIRSIGVTVEHDTKDAPLAHSGGRELFSVSLNRSAGGGDFGFWRYGLELERYLPLADDKELIFRFAGETNQEQSDGRVPFFEMARVGGHSSLRGFEHYRFQDKSSIAYSMEYRYRIWEYFDWGLFVDQAQVAPEPGDFALDGFHTGYGMRWLISPPANLDIGIDIAHGSEGLELYFKLNPRF
jgi:hypothetical protein